jgi:hypothetical protein
LRRAFLFSLFAVLALIISIPVAAQEEVQTLEWLTVELWPDYDRPAVLVLLTGALPEGAPLPATVTVPLPPEASVNAVARISESNALVDDIEFSQGENSLTLQTPDRRFRVEYYMPYAGSQLLRRFSFRWQSDLNVEQLAVTVQQPRLAPSIDISPQPDVVSEGDDGLQYYSLPVVAVPANESFAVDVQYTLEQEGLSVGVAGSAAAQETGPDWLLLAAVAAGILLLIIAAILLWPRLNAARRTTPRKPAPEHAHQARYCHNCGEPAQPGDRFCRQCGTVLKERVES